MSSPSPAITTHDPAEPVKTQAFWAVVIFAASLALSGLYLVIAHGTYDFDEFVYVLLGRAVAKGQLPYQSFLFYHPPGILVVMAFLQPLVHQWWAWGRSISLLLAAGTCSLVYLASRRFLSRPFALIAALLCACNPIMLASGTRIMPDVYVMFFTFLAVYLLMVNPRLPEVLRRTPWQGTWVLPTLAGMSFGIAIFFKYPAGLIVPSALILAGRKRWIFLLVATAATSLALFSPFLVDFSRLYQDTVTFQQSRFIYPLGIRILSVLLFAIVLQPLAAFGLFSKPIRWWLVAGYLSGFLYIASSQIYYHYMLPIVPFAALLGAIYLSRFSWVRLRALVTAAIAGAVALTAVWGAIMEYTPGNYPFHITSAQEAAVTPVTKYVDRHVSPTSQILDDQPDLPVLAYRNNCDDYFWSDNTVVSHSQLDECLLSVRYIIHFFGGGSGFPVGFLLRSTDGGGIPPLTIDDKFCRTPVGSGSYGAYVYDTTCNAPYLPPRN